MLNYWSLIAVFLLATEILSSAENKFRPDKLRSHSHRQAIRRDYKIMPMYNEYLTEPENNQESLRTTLKKINPRDLKRPINLHILLDRDNEDNVSNHEYQEDSKARLKSQENAPSFGEESSAEYMAKYRTKRPNLGAEENSAIRGTEGMSEGSKRKFDYSNSAIQRYFESLGIDDYNRKAPKKSGGVKIQNLVQRNKDPFSNGPVSYQKIKMQMPMSIKPHRNPPARSNYHFDSSGTPIEIVEKPNKIEKKPDVRQKSKSQKAAFEYFEKQMAGQETNSPLEPLKPPSYQQTVQNLPLRQDGGLKDQYPEQAYYQKIMKDLGLLGRSPTEKYGLSTSDNLNFPSKILKNKYARPDLDQLQRERDIAREAAELESGLLWDQSEEIKKIQPLRNEGSKITPSGAQLTVSEIRKEIQKFLEEKQRQYSAKEKLNDSKKIHTGIDLQDFEVTPKNGNKSRKIMNQLMEMMDIKRNMRQEGNRPEVQIQISPPGDFKFAPTTSYLSKGPSSTAPRPQPIISSFPYATPKLPNSPTMINTAPYPSNKPCTPNGQLENVLQTILSQNSSKMQELLLARFLFNQNIPPAKSRISDWNGC